MELKKRIHAGVCAVAGCKLKEPLFSAPHDGRVVQVCKIHRLTVSEETGAETVEKGDVLQIDSTQEEIDAEYEDALDFLTAVKSLTITSNEQLLKVKAIITDVKDRNSALEEKKKTVTKPMLASLEAARALFRPAQSLLSEIESVLKGKILDFSARLEKQRDEAIAALRVPETISFEGAQQQELALQKLGESEMPKVEGLVFRGVWDFKVTDESAVPAAYLSIDEKKVKEAIKTGVRQIPGIEIFFVKSVAVGS